MVGAPFPFNQGQGPLLLQNSHGDSDILGLDVPDVETLVGDFLTLQDPPCPQTIHEHPHFTLPGFGGPAPVFCLCHWYMATGLQGLSVARLAPNGGPFELPAWVHSIGVPVG